MILMAMQSCNKLLMARKLNSRSETCNFLLKMKVDSNIISRADYLVKRPSFLQPHYAPSLGLHFNSIVLNIHVFLANDQ